jgi:hypothetical protein
LHGVFVTLQIQVAVFRISLKDALPLQISSNPLLMMALGTWHPQKAVFQPPAFEVIGKFLSIRFARLDGCQVQKGEVINCMSYDSIFALNPLSQWAYAETAAPDR